MQAFPETPSPEECASTIFEISGTKFDADCERVWVRKRDAYPFYISTRETIP
jgi:hypothetical protein